MKRLAVLRESHLGLLGLLVLLAGGRAEGQSWDAVQYFRQNIENVLVRTTDPGAWEVVVVFSITNPATPGQEAWDIQSDAPFTSAGARVVVDIGWAAGSDFTNTGSENADLSPIFTTSLGRGAALPVSIRDTLTSANPCLSFEECPGAASLDNRYWVSRTVTPVGFVEPVSGGIVVLEGHPVCNGLPNCPAGPPFEAVPVRSVFKNFSFLETAELTSAVVPDPRRPIVDIAKCMRCHDGGVHGGTEVPRLAMHGNNRNENLGVCVVCHQPNQTDIEYRTSKRETGIDFKRLIHAIHAGGFRENPFVVVGFQGTVFDFSHVRFPAELNDCLNCHVETAGRGSFELPLDAGVLGSTVFTWSRPAPEGRERKVDVNPFNDLRNTPTAAVCSSCHDERENLRHMVRTGGARLLTLQKSIGTRVVERCASCHGPGKSKDVRRVHLEEN